MVFDCVGLNLIKFLRTKLDKIFINKILNLAYLKRNSSSFNKILFFDKFLSIYMNFMNNIVTEINYNNFFKIL